MQAVPTQTLRLHFCFCQPQTLNISNAPYVAIGTVPDVAIGSRCRAFHFLSQLGAPCCITFLQAPPTYMSVSIITFVSHLVMVEIMLACLGWPKWLLLSATLAAAIRAASLDTCTHPSTLDLSMLQLELNTHPSTSNVTVVSLFTGEAPRDP